MDLLRDAFIPERSWQGSRAQRAMKATLADTFLRCQHCSGRDATRRLPDIAEGRGCRPGGRARGRWVESGHVDVAAGSDAGSAVAARQGARRKSARVPSSKCNPKWGGRARGARTVPLRASACRGVSPRTTGRCGGSAAGLAARVCRSMQHRRKCGGSGPKQGARAERSMQHRECGGSGPPASRRRAGE